MPLQHASSYCLRCAHIWQDPSGERPQQCPACSRTDWDAEADAPLVCRHCGTEWEEGGQDSPCPSCGNPHNLLPDGTRTYRCLCCGHPWSRKAPGFPSRCPSCRNPAWNTRRFHDHVCRSCGHRWRNGTESPKRCPVCRSTRWDGMLLRLQCRRCGHRWSTYRPSGDDVRMCPSCKSPGWNQPPAVGTCLSCGTLFTPEPGHKVNVCRVCRGSGGATRRTCPFCGTVWNAPGKGRICPSCGTDIVRESGRTMTLWCGEDGSKLVFSRKDDVDVVYLFAEGIPVAAMYLSDVLDVLGLTVATLMEYVNNRLLGDKFRMLAGFMEAHREDYRRNIPFFMENLRLSEKDARILALHFTGMGPEAISLCFGISARSVRGAFDRIMEAYGRWGVVVDDSVYTRDPFAEYRKQLGG